MKRTETNFQRLFSPLFARSALVLLVVLIFSHCSASAAQEAWQWIYKDDTCVVFADFTTLHVWDKPEGDCADIYTMTNLSNLGRKELLTGREIANKSTSGWETVTTIVTRQLFLLKGRKVQMMAATYYDSAGKVLEEERYTYSPERWTPIRSVERSQKVYDIIVNIAKNTK